MYQQFSLSQQFSSGNNEDKKNLDLKAGVYQKV